MNTLFENVKSNRFGKYYHAWNNVFIDGEWQFLDITGELGGFVNDMPYTPERYY